MTYWKIYATATCVLGFSAAFAVWNLFKPLAVLLVVTAVVVAGAWRKIE